MNNFKCSRCPKAFKAKLSLARHTLAHKPEKEWPIKCEFCDKYFQAKADLAGHWESDSKHKGDKRIPAPDSAKWAVAMERCELYNLNEVAEILINNQVVADLSDSESMDTESCASSEVTIPPVKQEFLEDPDMEYESDRSSDSDTEELGFHGFVPGRDFAPRSKKPKLEDEEVPSPSGVRLVEARELVVKLERINYACLTCGQAFESESARDAHAKKSHQKAITCKICDRNYFDLESLRSHEQRRHGGKSAKKEAGGDKAKTFDMFSTKKFRCNTCKKSFSGQDELAKHEKIHGTSEKKFRCKECPNVYSSEESLKDHVQRRHITRPATPKPFKCKTCYEGFESYPLLQKHEATHSGDKIFQCTTCKQSFKQKILLDRHTLTHTGEKPYNCRRCGVGFSRPYTLTLHEQRCNTIQIIPKGEKVVSSSQVTLIKSNTPGLNKEDSKKSYRCKVCNKKYRDSDSYRKHKATHEKSYKCKTCGKKFGDRHNLKKHEENHSHKRDKCTNCQASFDDKQKLHSHMLDCKEVKKEGTEDDQPQVKEGDIEVKEEDPEIKEEEPEIKEEEPDIKKEDAATKEDAEVKEEDPEVKQEDVEVKEENDNLLPCPTCKKPFTMQKNLDKHKLKCGGVDVKEEEQESPKAEPKSAEQTGEAFRCQTCTYTTNDKEDLKEHEEYHEEEEAEEDEELYSCDTCGKTFTDHDRFEKHMQSHKGEKFVVPHMKKYQCTECAKGFEDLPSLQLHQQLHSGARQLYVCEGCDCPFTTPRALEKHDPVCTGESYPCHLCDLGFPTREGLQSHQHTHSKAKEPVYNGDKQHECNGCGVRYVDRRSLDKHELKCTGVSFKCDFCDETFSTRGLMLTHELKHTGKDAYICKICNKRFSEASGLINHEKTHSNTRAFQCGKCSVRYSTKENWEKHEAKCNGVSFKCDFCDEAFTQRGLLLSHELKHTGQDAFICKICNKRFSEAAGLMNHEKTHVNSRAFQCGKCSVRYSTKENWEKHEAKCNGVSYKCNFCNEAFSSRGLQLSHEIKHTGLDSYICNICNKAFAEPSGLINHEKTHTNAKAFKCGKCSVTYCSKENWEKHETKCTGVSFKCDFCDEAFTKRGMLLSHELKHTGQDAYICKICNKRFSEAAGLINHEKTHVNSRAFQCGKCSVRYSTKENWEKHEEKCNGESWPCEQCDEVFQTRGRLLTHNLSHTNEELYKCPVCDKCFKEVGSFMDHEKTHTGVKQFRCGKCSVRYSTKEHWEKHEAKCNGESWPCKQCDEVFQSRGRLLVHQQACEGQSASQQSVMREPGQGNKPSHTVAQGQEMSTVERPFICKTCGNSFKDVGNLQKHEKTHTREDYVTCTKCMLAYSNRKTLEQHFLSCTGESYPCQACGEYFKSRGRLLVHQQACQQTFMEKKFIQDEEPSTNDQQKLTDERPFKCEICGSGFADVGNLQRHERTHTKEDYVTCNKCGVDFSDKRGLQKHYPICTGQSFPCHDCGDAFTTRGRLLTHQQNCNGVSTVQHNRHLQTFSEKIPMIETFTKTGMQSVDAEERKFACSQCGKQFKDVGVLQSHEKIHAADRPMFTCQKCQVSYGYWRSLDRHVPKCNGISFACNYCSMRFTHRGKMLAHELTHTGETKFQCSLCPFKTDHVGSLQNHEETHTDKNHARCEKCFVLYKSRDHLQEHQAKCTGESWPCGACGEVFKSRGRLLTHQQQDCHDDSSQEIVNTKTPGEVEMMFSDTAKGSSSTEKPFTCSTCGKGFQDVSTFIKHEKRHTGKDHARCEKCFVLYKTRECLIEHQAKCTGKSWPCEACGEVFKSRGRLLTHQQQDCHDGSSQEADIKPPSEAAKNLPDTRKDSSSNEKPYTCSTCGKGFREVKRLIEHEEIHTGKNHARCEKCFVLYKTRENLLEHQAKCNGKSWPCGVCGEVFKSRGRLLTHQQQDCHDDSKPSSEAVKNSSDKTQGSSGNEKPYTCSTCGKGFREAYSLIEHEKIHSETRKTFTCTGCQVSYVDIGTLERHEKKCTGISFACGFCALRFTTRGKMLVHEKTHTGQEKFMCWVCDKQFDDVGTLQQHEKIHTENSKRFPCATCHMKFRDKSGQQKHQRICKGESWPCQSCDEIFTSRGRLMIHEQQSHAGMTSSAGPKMKNLPLPQHMKDELRGTTDDREKADNTASAEKGTKKLPLFPKIKEELSAPPDDVEDQEKIENRPFNCNECDKNFAEAGHLLQHQRRIHQKATHVKCKKCHVEYTNTSSLVKHMNKCSGDSYGCLTCGSYFPTQGRLLIHERTHTGSTKFPCDTCGKEFEEAGQLISHQRTHTKEDRVLCSQCHVEYADLRSLQKHSKRCKGESYRCDVCGQFLSTRGRLLIHELTHSGKTEFKCHLCNKTFHDVKNWQAHEKTHDVGETPRMSLRKRSSARDLKEPDVSGDEGDIASDDECFQCQECNKTFSTQAQLKTHKARVCVVKKPPTTDDTDMLVPKVILTEGKKTHACQTCELVFNNREELMRHEETHDDVMEEDVMEVESEDDSVNSEVMGGYGSTADDSDIEILPQPKISISIKYTPTNGNLVKQQDESDLEPEEMTS